MSDRMDQQVDALLATAGELDAPGLLALAAEPSSPDELDAARGRARELAPRQGLESDLERVEGRIAAWSFASVPRTASSQAWGAPGQDMYADLRGAAARALLDAVLATMLGTALDERDRDVLLGRWREATEPAEA